MYVLLASWPRNPHLNEDTTKSEMKQLIQIKYEGREQQQRQHNYVKSK